MFKNVTAAAVTGRAVEAGCAPDYRDPRCDAYFDESAASHGVDALKAFSLWHESAALRSWSRAGRLASLLSSVRSP